MERIAQQGRKGLINPIILSSLLNPLSAYFHLQHPSRGSIKGPFTNLSLPLQKKSLDLVWYLSNDSEDLESVKRLSDAVTKAVRGKEEIAERWRVLGLMN